MMMMLFCIRRMRADQGRRVVLGIQMVTLLSGLEV